MEMEVVWNGAHGGQDRDLLCARAIPEKRREIRPPVIGRPCHAEPVIAAITVCLQKAALNTRELEAITGFAHPAITAAIMTLRKRGVLQVTALPREVRRPGLPWVVYRYVERS